jgi:hypothetical protein
LRAWAGRQVDHAAEWGGGALIVVTNNVDEKQLVCSRAGGFVGAPGVALVAELLVRAPQLSAVLESAAARFMTPGGGRLAKAGVSSAITAMTTAAVAFAAAHASATVHYREARGGPPAELPVEAEINAAAAAATALPFVAFMTLSAASAAAAGAGRELDAVAAVAAAWADGLEASLTKIASSLSGKEGSKDASKKPQQLARARVTVLEELRDRAAPQLLAAVQGMQAHAAMAKVSLSDEARIGAQASAASRLAEANASLSAMGDVWVTLDRVLEEFSSASVPAAVRGGRDELQNLGTAQDSDEEEQAEEEQEAAMVVEEEEVPDKGFVRQSEAKIKAAKKMAAKAAAPHKHKQVAVPPGTRLLIIQEIVQKLRVQLTAARVQTMRIRAPVTGGGVIAGGAPPTAVVPALAQRLAADAVGGPSQFALTAAKKVAVSREVLAAVKWIAEGRMRGEAPPVPLYRQPDWRNCFLNAAAQMMAASPAVMVAAGRLTTALPTTAGPLVAVAALAAGHSATMGTAELVGTMMHASGTWMLHHGVVRLPGDVPIPRQRRPTKGPVMAFAPMPTDYNVLEEEGDVSELLGISFEVLAASVKGYPVGNTENCVTTETAVAHVGPCSCEKKGAFEPTVSSAVTNQRVLHVAAQDRIASVRSASSRSFSIDNLIASAGHVESLETHCDECKGSRTLEAHTTQVWATVHDIVIAVQRGGVSSSDFAVAPLFLERGGRRYCLLSVGCRHGNHPTAAGMAHAYSMSYSGHWFAYVRKGVTGRGDSWYRCDDAVIQQQAVSFDATACDDIRKYGAVFWYALDTGKSTRARGLPLG